MKNENNSKQNSEGSSGDFLELKNNRYIMDKNCSEKFLTIKNKKPESHQTDGSDYEWSEIGMASLFHEVYEDEASYCPEWRTWLVYHTGKWVRDEGAILVSEKLKEFVRLMIIYCGEIEDDDKRKAYTIFVNKMGDRRMRDRILKDATGEFRKPACEFDKDAYLINCKNGTYNLKDFTFYPARASDYITMQTNFDFTVNREVSCPRWEKFIDEVTEGDQEKADFLQRALGYSIIGMSNEECMFILYGKTTRNGKSTLLNTIEEMMGDYATVAPVGIICRGDRKRDEEAASPTLAGLKGKRIVTMAESNEYGALDEERIKQMTGGEEITARALYQSAITYKPQFTLWLSCNDLPAVRDKSLFASNRIKVIEFTKHFSPKEQDTHLKDELLSPKNMKGIFMWLIVGWRHYLSEGLKMPDSIAASARRYEEVNDLTLQFLRAYCQKDASKKITRTELHKRYKMWCRSESYHPLSGNRFRDDMERHSDWYDQYEDDTYIGLGLKDVMS